MTKPSRFRRVRSDAFPSHVSDRPEIDFGALALGERGRRTLDAALDRLALPPGRRRDVVELAKRVAAQGLRQPYPFGTRLESVERPGRFAVFVGSKPSGYREEIFGAPERGRAGMPSYGPSVALVWTVDEDGRTGIAQARSSDWRAVPVC